MVRRQNQDFAHRPADDFQCLGQRLALLSGADVVAGPAACKVCRHRPSLCCVNYAPAGANNPVAAQTPLKALKPPSTAMTWPVTKPDPSSLNSHSSVPSRSSGLPKCPCGVWVVIVLPRAVSEPSGCVSKLRFWSVRKKPGAMALTRTPVFEKCTASHWVKLLTPALAAL